MALAYADFTNCLAFPDDLDEKLGKDHLSYRQRQQLEAYYEDSGSAELQLSPSCPYDKCRLVLYCFYSQSQLLRLVVDQLIVDLADLALLEMVYFFELDSYGFVDRPQSILNIYQSILNVPSDALPTNYYRWQLHDSCFTFHFAKLHNRYTLEHRVLFQMERPEVERTDKLHLTGGLLLLDRDYIDVLHRFDAVVYKQLFCAGNFPHLVVQPNLLVQYLVVVDFYAFSNVQQLADVEYQFLIVLSGLPNLLLFVSAIGKSPITVDHQRYGYPLLATGGKLAVEHHRLILIWLVGGLAVQDIDPLVEVHEAFVDVLVSSSRRSQLLCEGHLY